MHELNNCGGRRIACEKSVAVSLCDARRKIDVLLGSLELDVGRWTLDVERWMLSVLFMHGERRGGACLELVE